MGGLPKMTSSQQDSLLTCIFIPSTKLSVKSMHVTVNIPMLLKCHRVDGQAVGETVSTGSGGLVTESFTTSQLKARFCCAAHDNNKN